MMYSGKKCYRCKGKKVICYLSGDSFLYYCQDCHHEWKRSVNKEVQNDRRMVVRKPRRSAV